MFWSQPMRFSRPNHREMFSCFWVFAAICVAGCGNSCFVGISNNGNGTATITVANPPPACSLSQGMGMMNMVAVKTAACETCPATTRVEHAFVTVQSIRLRPTNPADTNSPDGFDLAPQLATQPRRVDLIGDSFTVLLENALVPAGSYRELQLQFVPEFTDRFVGLSKQECSGTLSNCTITSQGDVQPLQLPGDPPELVIPFEGNSMVVLPDARVDLRLSLRPQVTYVSSSEGWKTQTILVGNAEVARP
jgi:hypothetical protein